VLYFARFISLICGAFMVYFCWAAIRELIPDKPSWAVAAAAMVALVPQFSFNNVTAANDSTVNMMGTLSFFLWFRGLRRPDFDRRMLLSGAVLGLAILSKMTAAVLIPGIALTIFFRAFQGAPPAPRPRSVLNWWGARLSRFDYMDGQTPDEQGEYNTVREQFGPWLRYVLRRFLLMLGGATLAALLVCGWWLVRNQIIYGDFTGSEQAFRFYIGRFNVLNINDPGNFGHFIKLSWFSFWGIFGWFNIWLPDELFTNTFWVTMAFVALTGVALVWSVIRIIIRRTPVPAYRWQAAVVLVPVAILLIYGYIRFSTDVNWQSQGRYLFMLMLPLSLIFTAGIFTIIPRRLPRVLVTLIPVAWIAFLNAVGIALVYTVR
jgi:4-amino-4-deoxy-L-arabinose transferase-like glycosyltransferase